MVATVRIALQFDSKKKIHAFKNGFFLNSGIPILRICLNFWRKSNEKNHSLLLCVAHVGVGLTLKVVWLCCLSEGLQRFLQKLWTELQGFLDWSKTAWTLHPFLISLGMWATPRWGSPAWGGSLQRGSRGSSANSIPSSGDNQALIGRSQCTIAQLYYFVFFFFFFTVFCFQTAPNMSQTSTVFSSTYRRLSRSEVLPCSAQAHFSCNEKWPMASQWQWQGLTHSSVIQPGLRYPITAYFLFGHHIQVTCSQSWTLFLVSFHGEWCLCRTLPHGQSIMNLCKNPARPHLSTRTGFRWEWMRVSQPLPTTPSKGVSGKRTAGAFTHLTLSIPCSLSST